VASSDTGIRPRRTGPAGRARAGVPMRVRAWLALVLLAGAALPVLLVPLGHEPCGSNELWTGLLVLVASILSVEIGRRLEGGFVDSQRPHKALSAWAFATALLLPTWWLLPVVAITYAHARWRGLRVLWWKWIGSALYLVLCGLGAAIVAAAVCGPAIDLMDGTALRGLLAVLASAATFLLLETLLFHTSAYLNHAEDEVWLRKTLRSPSFYVTESAVLLVGGLSAAMFTGGPWILVLLLPVYALAQRAALLEPLRDRADHDDKTGVLRFDSWRALAVVGADRCWRRQRPWAVVFLDIDHFKRFNDSWGHLTGDVALVAVARTAQAVVGESGLIGRFGGEEFCVFLPDADEAAAAELAERIRHRVADLDLVSGVTVSLGVSAVAPDRDVEFDAVLRAADMALFDAKKGGRNLTVARAVVCA